MASDPITIEELCGLGERSRHIFEASMAAAAQGHPPHPLFMQAHERVWAAATYLVLWLHDHHRTKFPKGVDVLDKPFSREEARAWLDRIHARASGPALESEQRDLWKRLYAEMLNLTIVATRRDEEAEELRTPDMKLVTPGDD